MAPSLVSIAEGGPDWKRWQRLVRAASDLDPEDPATETQVAEAEAVLDAEWPAGLRDAPSAWWNALQAGEPAPAWKLARQLNLASQADDGFVPCRAPESLSRLERIIAPRGALDPAALRAATSLRHLEIELSAAEAPASLEVIAGLPSLESLHLTLDGADLDPAVLSAFAAGAPQELHVASDVALSGVAKLPGLRRINFDPAPVDVAEVLALEGLESLSLTGIEWSTDWSLSRQLVEVTLMECPKLRSLDPFRDLPGLAELVLYDCPDLPRIELRGFSSLTAFTLMNAPTSEVSAGPDCAALTAIWLRELPKVGDLSSLRVLPALDQVTATGCPNATGLDALEDAGVTVYR